MALSTTRSESEAISNSIPPLENGDRLSRMEFERRYSAMPDLKKAELIEGIVYMPSPVRHRLHGRPHSHVMGWLIPYEAGTTGVQVGDNSTVRLDLDNEPQPDAILLIEPESSGQTRLSEDGYIEGAPELVVEVAASTASYDLHTKLNVYRRGGVQEYLVWRVQDEAIDWFVLRDEQYEPLQPDREGRLCSAVFAGLWLDPAALIRHELTSVLSVVQEGLASPEHVVFVDRLTTPQ